MSLAAFKNRSKSDQVHLKVNVDFLPGPAHSVVTFEWICLLSVVRSLLLHVM